MDHTIANTALTSFLDTQVVFVAIAWAALIPALISAFAMLRGNGSGSGSSTGVTSATTDPNMTAILDLQRRRMEMQNPLYEAVQRLAMGLMPTAYQTGNTSLTRPGSSTDMLGPQNPPGETGPGTGYPEPPYYGNPGGGGRSPWISPPDVFTPEYLRRATPPQRRPV